MIATPMPERKKMLLARGGRLRTWIVPVRCSCGHLERHRLSKDAAPLAATLELLGVAQGRCHRCQRGGR